MHPFPCQALDSYQMQVDHHWAKHQMTRMYNKRSLVKKKGQCCTFNTWQRSHHHINYLRVLTLGSHRVWYRCQQGGKAMFENTSWTRVSGVKGVLVVWKKTCLKGQLCSNIYSHITLTTSRFLLRFSKAGICEQWVSDLRPDMDSMQLRSQPYCSSS